MKKFLTAAAFACLLPGAAFAQGAGDAAAGKTVWAGPLFCKNCHGNDGEGGYGPDLAGRGLSVSQFSQAVRKPWGVMPAFVESQLSDAEIANLTAYFATLPKVASTGPWRFATPTSAPAGQQVLHDTGCAQCHGPTFDMPRALMGGVNADFALFKDIVYKHTTVMPEVEEELDAGNPPRPPGPPNRLRMGNYNPTRVTEAQLKAIYDWSKDEIGFRPMLQGRIAANGATYTVTVTNAGLKGKGIAAQGLKIGVILPSGVDVVSTTGAGYKGVHMDADAKGNVAEWDVAQLNAKDSVSMTITLSKAVPTTTPQESLRGMIHWDSPKSKTGPVQVQNIAPPPAAGGARGPG